jgi:hypothetical protein
MGVKFKMTKKLGVLVLALLCMSIFFLSFVSAINLKVTLNPIQKSFISDLNEPAVMELTINNLGDKDTFKIYSLVGVEIKADEVTIGNNESKNVTVYISSNPATLLKSGSFTFEYKIKNSKNEIYTDYTTINIVSLKDAVSVATSNLNPQSQAERITIQNNVDYEFKDLNVKVYSAFFTFEKTFDLGKSEKKEFDAPLNLEKLKESLAGSYLSDVTIKNKGVLVNSESIIDFVEQEDIKTTTTQNGILIRKTQVTKDNTGNVAKQTEITSEKNILSYLFTTFNTAPTDVDRNGLNVIYTWQKELAPNEVLKVIVTTNWIYPIIIIALIIFLFWIIKQYVESDIILSKNVSFVRTTGGEFALKVSLKARSKRYFENIHIIEKLPHLVELYPKFGAIAPDNVDLRNRRLEWNIKSMNSGEEKIFSYIIYSKIGVVGKFELPCARATYKKNGKAKTVESNRSFFINQPKKKS